MQNNTMSLSLNNSQFGLNSSQINRNSNIKKVIRGGRASIHQRSSTIVSGNINNFMQQSNQTMPVYGSFIGASDTGPFEKSNQDFESLNQII